MDQRVPDTHYFISWFLWEVPLSNRNRFQISKRNTATVYAHLNLTGDICFLSKLRRLNNNCILNNNYRHCLCPCRLFLSQFDTLLLILSVMPAFHQIRWPTTHSAQYRAGLLSKRFPLVVGRICWSTTKIAPNSYWKENSSVYYICFILKGKNANILCLLNMQ